MRGESEKIILVKREKRAARAKRTLDVCESKVSLFVLSFFSLSASLLLTCSRHSARAFEYILGGKSELEGAERKRAILAHSAGGDDQDDVDEDFFAADDDAPPKLVDLGDDV